MQLQQGKNDAMIAAWIVAGVGVLMGLLLILIPGGFLLKVVFAVMGIITVLSNHIVIYWR